MRTLNYVVLVLVLASFGFVSFGCGDDSSPTAPSVMQEAPPSVRATAPSTPVRGATPASFDADVQTVAPGDARYGPNAYDFFARMDSGMLHVALVEDAMQTMRNASQPHRMRQVDVYHVPSEPRHVLQTHGDPLYSGTVRLSGRLELPPIAIDGCATHEWIIVQAAELSDDRYDGWRNAPCPPPNGVVVGSDGSGPGWERSERGAPSRDFPPEPEPMPEPDDDDDDDNGRNDDDDNGRDDDDDNGRDDDDDNGRDDDDDNGGRDDDNGRNTPPTIQVPEDRTYPRGERVVIFIPVIDVERNRGEETVTVSVSGLPAGLSFDGEGWVSGTIDADPGLYAVSISAKDESNPVVHGSFVITVEGIPTALQVRIERPRDRFYQRGQSIRAFPISVDDDDVTLSVSGLPRGLSFGEYRERHIAGRVEDNAELDRHTVRIEAKSFGVVVGRQTFDIWISPAENGGSGGSGGSGGAVAGIVNAECAEIFWPDVNAPTAAGIIDFPYVLVNTCNRAIRFYVTDNSGQFGPVDEGWLTEFVWIDGNEVPARSRAANNKAGLRYYVQRDIADEPLRSEGAVRTLPQVRFCANEIVDSDPVVGRSADSNPCLTRISGITPDSLAGGRAIRSVRPQGLTP